MKTKVTHDGEFTVFEIAGYLNFESAAPLKQSILDIYEEDHKAKVIINLRGLEFVGSSGVSSFVKMLRNFNSVNMRPTYIGVKSEYIRLFRAFEEGKPFELAETEFDARLAATERFNRWQMTAERSKKTH